MLQVAFLKIFSFIHVFVNTGIIFYLNYSVDFKEAQKVDKMLCT